MVEPAVNAASRPCVHHYLACGCGDIAVCSVNRLAVNVPCDVVGLPVEAVGMITLGSIEAEIVHELVVALSLCIVVELYLSGILTEDFDIYLVPRIVIRRTCVGEE